TKELAQRSKELEAKNTDLSDFLYIASHDLRAPLINLAGFSHALQDSVATLDRLMAKTQPAGNGDAASHWPALKDDISESLAFILRSTAKMDTLVNALLELSRIETRPHVQQVVDTQQVVEELLGALHFQITEKKITVVTGRLPAVFGDPIRINQVFSNLIDNAIKHMPLQPEARIEVGCEEQGRYYRFFVRDTGAGIRQEDHDKVFRLFTRLGANGTPGEGVGLAAVKKIIDKHGGRIWVESEPGQGSTFWFTLPRPSSRNALPQTTAA
ncbi:MAG: ATP-binding protein, partial [Candidatus Binatia bacterium]